MILRSKLAVFLLIVLIIFSSGCTQRTLQNADESSGSEYSVEESLAESIASSETESEPSASSSDPEKEPQLLLEIPMKSISEIDSFPELDKPPVRRVVHLSLEWTFHNIKKLRSGKLRTLSVGDSDKLVQYCMRTLVNDSSTGYPFDKYPTITKTPDGKSYHVPADVMQAIAADCLEGDDILPFLQNSEFYSPKTNAYVCSAYQDDNINYGYAGSNFRVTETKQEDTIFAVVEWLQDDGTLIATTTATFAENTPEQWRLADAHMQTATPDAIQITGSLAPLDLEGIGEIAGVWNNQIFSREYANGILYASMLDDSNFSVQKQVEIPCHSTLRSGEIVPVTWSNNMVFLNLGNSVVVLNEQLEIVLQEELPQPILEAMQNGNLFDQEIEDWESYYGGYALAPDLSSYIYSIHGGVYRYDRKSGKSEKLFNSLGYGGNMIGEQNLFNLQFSQDGSKIIANITGYEGPANYYLYDLSKKTGSKQATDDLQSASQFLTKSLQMNVSLYPSSGSILVGQKYKAILKQDYNEGLQSFTIEVAPINEAFPNTPIISIKGANECEIIAVLNDGRVLFSASQAYVNDMGTYVTRLSDKSKD